MVCPPPSLLAKRVASYISVYGMPTFKNQNIYVGRLHTKHKPTYWTTFSNLYTIMTDQFTQTTHMKMFIFKCPGMDLYIIYFLNFPMYVAEDLPATVGSPSYITVIIITHVFPIM